MSYSQLMSQITLDPGVGTSDTQYECPRRKLRLTQDTSVLAVKSDQETHTACLSLGGCFVGIDVFFFISKTIIYICILFEK
jgi:hypothetical protein